MGEAIARFREAALGIRRLCDERLSEPTWAVAEPAAKNFCSRCRRLMNEFEAGHLGAEGYIRGLRQAKKTAELQPRQDERGQRRFALVEWLPASMRPAAVPKMKPLAVEAAQEALHWGPHFSLIESHIRVLSVATARLREGLGYAAKLSRWQEAFDALAPFDGEPPAAAAATSEKPTGDSRSRGGRPPNDEAQARDLLAGWKAFEPEDGRKTKERYLAQRPDVQVLKTPDARQRRIAALRVALESAQHLSREKTKQKRRARG